MTEQEARRILGISAETDMQEIKKRYRRLMLQAHPDAADPSGGSCGSHTLRAQEINLAYSCLLYTSHLQKETPNPWIEEQSWLNKTDVTYPVEFGGLKVTARMYDIEVTGLSLIHI